MVWFATLIRASLIFRAFMMAFCLYFASTLSYAKNQNHSPMITGVLGLNTVPSARMDPKGTIRAGTGTLDPYIHGYLGFQFTNNLYVSLRQSAEISEFNEDPDDLFPGVDIKFRIVKEDKYIPEISVGVQSAVGDKRLSGEYIAFSKRFKDFDFTGGVGWGRFGSAGHIRNPLSIIGSHFEDRRNFDDNEANEPDDLFTGRDVGFFGGVEYFTPVKGLSIKLDMSADRFEAEERDFDFSVPAAWSAGVNYAPYNGVNMSLATQGGDKIMGSISLSSLIQKWPGIQDSMNKESLEPLKPYRPETGQPASMALSARHEDIRLSEVTSDQKEVRATLQLRPELPLPYQAGRAFVHMANHAGPEVERLTITPTRYGLTGPSISVQRKDLEKMLSYNQGSPEELWQNTVFTTKAGINLDKLNRFEDYSLNPDPYYIELDNDISLAEEDSTFLFRSSVLLGARIPQLLGWLDYGIATRINTANNLERIALLRPPTANPIRSDVEFFAARGIALDHQYLALTHSFTNNLHVSALGGYLEEMFGGYGGEILYRPYNSRFAIGIEAFQAYKRNPFSNLNLSLFKGSKFTGHMNFFYDMAEDDLKLQAKIGRYLAGDFGGTLSLKKYFRNGVHLDGFLTLTNEDDVDLFGGSTNAFNGISINVPLGGFNPFLKNTSVNLDTSPLGRDTGQTIKNPIDLYTLTEPFSYAHNIKHWQEISP